MLDEGLSQHLMPSGKRAELRSMPASASTLSHSLLHAPFSRPAGLPFRGADSGNRPLTWRPRVLQGVQRLAESAGLQQSPLPPQTSLNPLPPRSKRPCHDARVRRHSKVG